MNYINGNATINIDDSGTRIIEYNDNLKLDYPLNLDIRVSTSCSFANNICKDFCHESAVVNGKDCDYEILQSKLNELPSGIELAIGCNTFTQNLFDFLEWCYNKGYICNLTVNQGHINRDYPLLKLAIDKNFVKGLGISYRKTLRWNIPTDLLNYSNTVFHVIAGIDTIEDVMLLSNKGVRKVLVLGEKDFGYNTGHVDLERYEHKQWYWWIGKLFNMFEVVSFDNLALEQLNIKRFFTQDNWNIFNQGEYSFYIDAVNEHFKPSSRSADSINWNDTTISEYFKSLNHGNF